MKVSLPDNRDVGEAVGDSNEGMKEAYDVGQAEMRINSAKERMRAEAEGARDAGKIIENTGPRTKPSKPAIVTKEELAKSGYGNLRDYLNAKQGLTRRKEKTPTPKLIDPSNIRSGPRFDDEGLIDPSNIRSGRREFEESQIAPAPVDVTKLSLAERRKLSRENSSGSGPTDTRSVNQRMRAAFGMRKGGAVKGYASGGTVSSASKRADGIATKGKTRGKMY
jgi:hypothetical protein